MSIAVLILDAEKRYMDRHLFIDASFVAEIIGEHLILERVALSGSLHGSTAFCVSGGRHSDGFSRVHVVRHTGLVFIAGSCHAARDTLIADS